MSRVLMSLTMAIAALAATWPVETAHGGSVKSGCRSQSPTCEDPCSKKKDYHTFYRNVQKVRKRRVWRTEHLEVKKTCYKIVPETCYKTVKCTEYKTEKRTCYKTVKETCYKEVKYTVCKPVTECHMVEESYTVCTPKTVYKPVTKEICQKTKVCEYLPPTEIKGDVCNQDSCCQKKGLLSVLSGLCGKQCCNSCGQSSGKSEGKSEEVSRTVKAEGMWIQRPAVIYKTITCMVPCTTMEKKECKRMVPCKTTRIVEEKCTKMVPYTVCKKVPYCVIEKVPHKVCDIVCEVYTCKVPYRVRTNVPVSKTCAKGGFLGNMFSKKCNTRCESDCASGGKTVSESASAVKETTAVNTTVKIELKPAPAPKSEN